MIDQVLRLLGYDFAQNALAAGIAIAVVSGVVSRFVVARNMSFAVHALAELGFTGAAGAVLLGVSPVGGLLVGTTVSALLIGSLGVRLRERDTVVGVVMAFGLGLGVLFLTLYPRYATEAFAILFGTITGVSRGDVALLIGIGLVTLLALGVVYRPLTFATVDPEVAEARGVPVRALGVIFLLIMAAAVAEAVQVVGVLLILTLLITPGASAERLTASPGHAIALSVGIALLSVIGGILLSLAVNLPVSVFVTTLSFMAYLVARFALGPLTLGRQRRVTAITAAPSMADPPRS
jgi:zinc/manganese transport system permease protein